MLELLRIQNYALIEQLEVEFNVGFNALTGETGAGKSIVVGALNLVLGARASGAALRTGAQKAHIEALFHLDVPSPALAALLEAHEIHLEDGALLLARTITADGRSRGYAGGRLVPIHVLAALGDELVDLHGQHEHQSLLKTERQLDLLDGFAELETQAAALQEQVQELRRLEKRLQALEQDDRDKTRQMEFLRFEVEEINEAGLGLDEETVVRERLQIINNAENIYTLANQAWGLLYENEQGAAIDAVDAALKSMEDLAEINAELRLLYEQLSELRVGLEAVAGEIRLHTEHVEYDPEELESLNQRLALIGGLKRKYGGSVAEILAYRDRAAAELEEYEQRDVRLEEIRQQHAELQEKALAAARNMSKKRKQAARKLDKRVQGILQNLGMKGARFETRFEAVALGSRGIDRVTFMLAANKGEALHSLKQVASGGEISRIMLALKSAFAQADTIPTLIFDEIDSGVGGAIARKVADKLRELAATHQVICITHIPQIAALANAHYQVQKHSVKDRTTTCVLAIDDEHRVEELARLLDGTLSTVSREHARALLEDAENGRSN